MILPFPTRIPIYPALAFTCLLVLIELIEGTDPRFAALVFAFFLISVFAFNVVHGLSRPSGAYILSYSVLVVGIGTIYKAWLGQPAETNLSQPLLAMSAYVATIIGLFLAGFVSSRFTTTKDGIAGVFNVRETRFRASASGCLIVHFTMIAAFIYLPGGGGQILHSIALVSPFLLLTGLLGTIGAIQDSAGKRSFNLISLIALSYMLIGGMLAFSKQGMFIPAVCWLLGAAWARFRLRAIHIVALAIYIVCAVEVFTSISASRDDIQTGTTAERLSLLEHYITHLDELHARASTSEVNSRDFAAKMLYYGKPQGLWDRLTMMPNDALLISFSDQGHYFGYTAVAYYFANVVPRVIAPNKLKGKLVVGGNLYAHEMGGLADFDTTTGISFSPTAEAYHIDGWRGVLLLQPAIFLLLFCTVDTVTGDIRRHPWGLFLTLAFAHVAPEALLGGAITATVYGSASIILAVFVCGYITPVLGMLVSGTPSVLSSGSATNTS